MKKEYNIRIYSLSNKKDNIAIILAGRAIKKVINCLFQWLKPLKEQYSICDYGLSNKIINAAHVSADGAKEKRQQTEICRLLPFYDGVCLESTRAIIFYRK